MTPDPNAILPQIKGPADVKALDFNQLPALAQEIRERIIQVTASNGGHIGPNLGVVELSIALHRHFSTPTDKFVFDVSHQCYVHKLLTGRNGDAFDLIRLSNGLSGFMNREESPHDVFGAGHAGTALSAALGMAVARDLNGSDEHVIALVGDAAFTCGITMEALNNIAGSTKRLIVILNDNKWSIAPNVGSIARYFNELITNPLYNRIDRDMHTFLGRIPGGKSLIRFARKWKKETKDFFVSSSLFETYGLRYLGPIDGHDFAQLDRYLDFAKNSDIPVLLHVLTNKGRGYEPAVASPEKFHGTSPFEVSTGKGLSQPNLPPTYQDAFGKALLRFAKDNPKVVGITAAMPPGTGLVYLRENAPKQFFDVGIAEEHAVIFAAGLATQGFRPVVAIYSTFLQRAYDNIIHDICLQNLPVVFCMDRAGLSPNDGPTHHGLFDIAFLNCVPRAVIMQPMNEDELTDMLWTALQHDGPVFIRYPRGNGCGIPIKQIPESIALGRAQPLEVGTHIQIWAIGPWVETALKLQKQLSTMGISVGVTNARFIKPIDRELIAQQARTSSLFITMEDHVTKGGMGSVFLEALHELNLSIPLMRFAWPDAFVGHASSVEALKLSHQLDDASILNAITAFYRQLNLTQATHS
jgi:1-deoxy-D-xylulose-5-phosphate synthase